MLHELAILGSMFTLCLLCYSWWFFHGLEDEVTDCSFRSSVDGALQTMALLKVGVTWLWRLLHQFGVYHTTHTLLLSDNICSTNIARGPVKHELTKHIGANAAFVRAGLQDQVYCSFVCAFRVSPLADFFMKARLEHNTTSISPNQCC